MRLITIASEFQIRDASDEKKKTTSDSTNVSLTWHHERWVENRCYWPQLDLTDLESPMPQNLKVADETNFSSQQKVTRLKEGSQRALITLTQIFSSKSTKHLNDQPAHKYLCMAHRQTNHWAYMAGQRCSTNTFRILVNTLSPECSAVLSA